MLQSLGGTNQIKGRGALVGSPQTLRSSQFAGWWNVYSAPNISMRIQWTIEPSHNTGKHLCPRRHGVFEKGVIVMYFVFVSGFLVCSILHSDDGVFWLWVWRMRWQFFCVVGFWLWQIGLLFFGFGNSSQKKFSQAKTPSLPCPTGKWNYTHIVPLDSFLFYLKNPLPHSLTPLSLSLSFPKSVLWATLCFFCQDSLGLTSKWLENKKNLTKAPTHHKRGATKE